MASVGMISRDLPSDVAFAATLDRHWLIPSAVMTALLGIAAYLLMPLAGYDEIPPFFARFKAWLIFSTGGAALALVIYVLKLWRAGVADPIAHIRSRLFTMKVTIVAAVAGILLAGADILFFMWIKPEVTAVSPFWTDKLWADIDHALFGMDPWRLFQGFDLTFHAWVYSVIWAIAISLALVWLFAQRPSIERNASLLSYFALWSIFGPIVQFLLSAAGPIFYRRVGLGDRFLELESRLPFVTRAISDYLWTLQTAKEPAAGAGIAAMPSLHITMVVWIFLAFRQLRSPMAPLAGLFAVYIFILSVALGWHYAADGLVGAVGAILSYMACRAYLLTRNQPRFDRREAVQMS